MHQPLLPLNRHPITKATARTPTKQIASAAASLFSTNLRNGMIRDSKPALIQRLCRLNVPGTFRSMLMPRWDGNWFIVAIGQILRHTPGAVNNNRGRNGIITCQKSLSPASGREPKRKHNPTSIAIDASCTARHMAIGRRRGSLRWFGKAVLKACLCFMHFWGSDFESCENKRYAKMHESGRKVKKNQAGRLALNPRALPDGSPTIAPGNHSAKSLFVTQRLRRIGQRHLYRLIAHRQPRNEQRSKSGERKYCKAQLHMISKIL